jgi:hypothetical protein
MTWSELVNRSIPEHEKHLGKKIRPFGRQIIELCELQQQTNKQTNKQHQRLD